MTPPNTDGILRELENHDTRLEGLEKRYDRFEGKLDALPGVIKTAVNECPARGTCAPPAVPAAKSDDGLDGTFRKVWVTLLLVIIAGLVQLGAWGNTPAPAKTTQTQVSK